MRVLVTGATGKAGREAVRALLARGAEGRALVRDPESARLPDAVEVVQGNVSEPGPAFEGVQAAHLLSGFADADTAKRAEHAGVRRVSLLWAGFWGPVEEVAEPFVDVAESMVHEADVDAMAATVLLESGHAGHVYELTGGEAVSVRDRVDAPAEALGRPLKLIELSEAEARRRWLAEGYDEGLADALVGWMQRPVEETTRVSPDAERVLGRPPLTFADWLSEHVDAFR